MDQQTKTETPAPRWGKRLKVAACAAVVALAAGCGQALHQSGVVDDAVAVVGGGYRLMGAMNGPLVPDHPLKEMAKKLNLSVAQQDQLTAIARKHRDQLKPADFEARKAELKGILTAESVDSAALKAWIATFTERFEDRRPGRQAMAAEMREVLTPAQREQLAVHIETGRPQAVKRVEAARKRIKAHAISRLGLTSGQISTFEAAGAKLQALRDGGQPQVVRQAMAAFVRTGDTTQLTKATTGILDSAPVDEIVAVAACLDQGQRQAIVSHVEAVIKMRLKAHDLPR